MVNLGKKEALNRLVGYEKGKSWNCGCAFRMLAEAARQGVSVYGNGVPQDEDIGVAKDAQW